MALSKAAIVVRITSDVICPWCFVGKRHLEEASKLSSIPIEIVWEPFFLDRNIPKEGLSLLSYLTDKYGSKFMIQQYPKTSKHLDTTGLAMGIHFMPSEQRLVYPTMKAHIAMQWCYENHPEKANTLMHILFQAYFEQGRDISSSTVLLDCIQKADILLPTAESSSPTLESILVDEAYKSVVLDKASKIKGVNGVPYFSIASSKPGGRPITLSGAQPVDVFQEALVLAAGGK